jgi:peptide/nickel transport system substrate-binding protein
MNRNVFVNTAMVILLIAVCFFGIQIIGALDRLKIETAENAKALNRLNDTLQVLSENGFAVQAGTNNAASLNIAGKPFANAQFFDPKAVSGGRMIRAFSADTKNMNNIITNESFCNTLHALTDSSLAARNYKNPDIFEPLMAESWTISPDKLVYTIKLRPGILWHDFTDPTTGKKWENHAVTAADFKFYVDVVKNKVVNCAPIRSYISDLDRIEIINKYEFKVYWKKRYYLSKSMTLAMSPLPKHLYHAYAGKFDPARFNEDHQRNRLIVGCGPYRFVRWEKGQRIILERWGKYFGKKYGAMPPLKHLVFDLIKHPNTRFQSLLAKKIDQLGLMPSQWHQRTNIPEFKQGGFLRKFQYTGRAYYYLGWNLRNPLFKDRRVRTALTHLVDRQRIMKDVYFKLARITTGPFFIDSPYYDNSIKPYSFNLKKAKKLLAEAGWKDTDGDGILDRNGQKFEFTLMQVASHPIQTKMHPIIKEDMAKAGIVMLIQSVEWAVYIQKLNERSFEACSLGWGMSYESDPYQLWHSSQAEVKKSSNHISFRSKKGDRIIEELRTCFDRKRRIELAHEFHKLLHYEQPYTFLFAPDSLVALSNRYKNVHKFPLGLADEIMWTPKNQQLTTDFQ